ncbi:MobQ family relaxase [Rhodopseudomonas sp. RCAM05734]|uniref:MobQ family relaxase n=1 Tax=Rhodopseudomonas sp. RCAM05734 TaxID=3457549 RepID=UPI004044646A
MASYHLSVQPVKRSEGRSVVAMAAYRAGARLKDERRDMEVDYRRRRGVVHAEIMAPEGSAEWLLDRETLWNGVERMEVRRDAQLAREINMALPHELSDEQRLALVRRFVSKQFVALGMVADFAIHAPVVEKGDDPRNHHVHVLLTLRQAGEGGLRRVKTREWNSDRMLAIWRAAWADEQNGALRALGSAARVDHRSLQTRKMEAVVAGERRKSVLFERAPEIHVGPKAKKAARARPPQSKDRLVGRHRKRLVKYSDFDEGSRGEKNISRLEANARRLESATAKTSQQLARLHMRAAHYDRQVRRYQSHEAKSAEPIIDLSELFRDAENKYLHALRRREQVALLIGELDRLFFELLGLRESQLIRRTVWSNRIGRLRARDAEPTGGRTRPRT